MLRHNPQPGWIRLLWTAGVLAPLTRLPEAVPKSTLPSTVGPGLRVQGRLGAKLGFQRGSTS